MYFVIFGFLKGREDGKESVGAEGGETVVRIYCKRKEPVFSFQKKKQRGKGLKGMIS